MIVIDDRAFPDKIGKLEIVRRIGKREITAVIHDIDGTHSLIRHWQPVMSRCLFNVIKYGLPDDYNDENLIDKISAEVGTEPLPEMERFCDETAGLSSFTQMEWAIRRGIDAGTITVPGLKYNGEVKQINRTIIKLIEAGEEDFSAFSEPRELSEFIKITARELFRVYERVLYRWCRDKNLQEARENAEKWRVPGSLEFVRKLHQLGCKNYFVTGSVVSENPSGGSMNGIYEEAVVLGFEIGHHKMVEALIGSSATEKIHKAHVIKRLCEQENLKPENLLFIGDGRTEIKIGVELNAVALSRLPEDARLAREIHRQIGTNYIVIDFQEPALWRLLGMEK